MCKHVIDVSRHQGRMDWARAANAGCVAACARATMGLQSPNYSGYDEEFVRNWHGMTMVGVIRGAYHLFMPELDPSAQADWYISVVRDRPRWAVVDAELNAKGVPRAAFWARLLEWCIIVDQHWPIERGTSDVYDDEGRERSTRVVVYTRASFWNQQLGGVPWPLGKLWVAHYTQQPKPSIPKSWADWLLWQYSADENYRGGEFGAQSWAIDLSRYNGRL